jgi:Uma2 family endonuclease
LHWVYGDNKQESEGISATPLLVSLYLIILSALPLSWVKKERFDALSDEEREKFIPLCPDFVVEIRSSIDNIKPLQAKMDEYIENGVLLGLLIDPEKKIAYLYRPNQAIEILTNPTQISCEPEMPGLVFDTAVLFFE